MVVDELAEPLRESSERNRKIGIHFEGEQKKEDNKFHRIHRYFYKDQDCFKAHWQYKWAYFIFPIQIKPLVVTEGQQKIDRVCALHLTQMAML